MQTILVTGCAGFIGSHFTNELVESGYQVVGLDLLTYAGRKDIFFELAKRIPVFIGSICDSDFLRKVITENNVDLIVNFAAETHVDNSIKDSSQFISTNIIGVKSILDVIKETRTRLIHVSTDEVYGPATGNTRFDENSNISPKNPYAATKASADLMISAYRNTYGVDASILRPCNNFGPRQNEEKFIPTIARSIRLGKKIPVYGDGSQIREWMYVKDTAKIIRRIIDDGLIFDILNISTQKEQKNIDVVRRICESLGKDFQESVAFVEDRPGHDVRYSISSDLLRSRIDLEFTDFEVALSETLEYYEEKI